MNQRTKSPVVTTLTLILLGLSAVTGGCVHENPLSLELEGNLAMVRLPGAGEGITGQCLPGGELIFRPNGIFDLMVVNRYEFFPRIENKLPTTAEINLLGPANLRADASTVTIEGAQITLEMDTATAGPLKVAAGAAPPWRVSWFSPFITQLAAGQTIGSRFTLIPSDVGDAMRKLFGGFAGRRTARQQAILRVRLVGRMADGTQLESNTIPYPVDLCWGCLVSLPVAIEGVGVDPALQFAVCSTKLTTPITPPCQPGNDEFIPCQFYCFMCDQDNSCDDAVCPTL